MKPQVNLLPKYERYSNLSYILFIIGLILFLLLAGLLTYLFFQERSALQEAEAEVTMLTDEQAILEARLENESEVDTATLEDAVTFAESHAVPVSNLLDELVTLQPEASYLVNYEYDYYTTTIETHFETMTDTANYMELLSNSPYLTNAQVETVETTDPELEASEDEEVPDVIFDGYDIVPRYEATYSMDVNQEELMKEEEADE